MSSRSGSGVRESGPSVDYYHFGEAGMDLSDMTKHFANRQLIGLHTARDYLLNRGLPVNRCEAALDILQFIAGTGQLISPHRLKASIENGQRWRQQFQKLGCRGFSFRVAINSRLHYCWIRPDQKLNVALLTEQSLYYPPRVREALTRVRRPISHIPNSIGWILGQERRFQGQRWWFINNIQSDLMSNAASCLREIFRGWQRVLFWLLLSLARARGISRIAIPPASAVASGVDAESISDQRVNGWRPLYDGIGTFFNLPSRRFSKPLSIQPMLNKPKAYCSTFYVANVPTLRKQYGTFASNLTEVNG
jgi:hypothetical protein